MNAHVCSLYSGSSGNAFLIGCGEDYILIDAGRSARALCRAIAECGYDPDRALAIFLTPEHSDHVSALPVFLKSHPVPVHVVAASAGRLETQGTVAPHLVRHTPLYRVETGPFTVTSFPTPHDSRASVGYRVEIREGDEVYRVGYATDMGRVTGAIEEGLTGCEAVIIESNHDPDMLENGTYPDDLKRRIRSDRGHLSNPDCAVLAAKLAGSGTERILLAHLSRENNTPKIAYAETLGALAEEKTVLCVASPEEVTVLL